MTTTVSPDRARRSAEQPDQSFLAGLVQTGQRLVEDEHLRLAGQDAGQGHPALLPAAELVDAPVADLGRVEADRRQGGRHRGIVGGSGGSQIRRHRGPLQLQPGVLEGQTHRSHLGGDRFDRRAGPRPGRGGARRP